MLSSKMKMLIFTIVISISFLFLADLIGIYIPYASRYLAIIIAIGLYALFDRIRGRLKPTKL
jgi:hypothetical protein